jgi:hypothetical protein
MKRLVWRAFFALVAVLLSCLARDVNACSCVDYDIPPCAAYWGVDSVFTGLVTDVTPVSSESWGSMGGDVIVHFNVEQAFRGINETKVEVVSHGEQSSCNMGFKAGQRWLVYAYRTSNGKLATGPCIRTTQLPADEDLAYIIRVSGEARQSIQGRVGKSKYEPLEGVKVIVEGGNSKYQTTTNKEGKFSVSLPQAGTFKIRLFIPYSAFVMNLSKGYEEIKSDPTEKLTLAEYYATVPPDQCDYRLIVAPEKDLKATAEISGRILDSEGLAVSSQTVYLYPATPEQKFDAGGYQDTQTDKDGNYTFAELREGRYWLGLNLGHIPEVDSPYPKTFYPGTQDMKKAAAINLKQGQKLSKRDIQLPSKLIEREITGIIVWPDGSPALAPSPNSEFPGLSPDITVRDPDRLWYPINPRPADGRLVVNVDEGGHFSFIGFEGYAYIIIASAYDSDGKRVHSKAMKLTITRDVKPLLLVLSLSGDTGEDQIKKELGEKP